MKRIKYILTVVIGLFVLASCSDEVYDPNYNPKNAVASTLKAIDAAYTLQTADADSTFADFTFTKADYGISLAAKYTLQVALGGTNFASPTNLGTAESVKPISVIVSKINAFAIANGIRGEETGTVDFRIFSVVTGTSGAVAGIDTLFSNVVSTNVTPYAAARTFKSLSVPGAYQGWDPANYDQALYSKNGDNKYEGYIYFSEAGQFKIADGSWDADWGSTDGSTLVSGGDNLSVPDAGTYCINVDLDALTISIVKTNWSIIGLAVGGWETTNDVALTYDAANKVYSATVDLVAGEFKFRANQDWTVNLGTSTEANAEVGDLSYGGDNIMATAGKYTITLNLNSGIYSYKISAVQ